HDEHEKRLDQIPEAQAVPGMMVKLRADRGEHRAAERGVDEVIVDAGGLGDQEEHRQTAEEIERHEALFGLDPGSDLLGHARSPGPSYTHSLGLLAPFPC